MGLFRKLMKEPAPAPAPPVKRPAPAPIRAEFTPGTEAECVLELEYRRFGLDYVFQAGSRIAILKAAHPQDDFRLVIVKRGTAILIPLHLLRKHFNEH